MKERTIDILTAVFLIAFSLVMRSQLEGIPREGVLFPLCVLYLIMASSVLLALRAIMAGKGEMSFFGDIPPQRWCLVTAVFIAQVLGAMYVSFNICMAVGIFAMLIVLTPKKTGKALLANLVFTAAFIVFFQVFFTNIMHIYFLRIIPLSEKASGSSEQAARCRLINVPPVSPTDKDAPVVGASLFMNFAASPFRPARRRMKLGGTMPFHYSWMFCSGDFKPDGTAVR